MAVVVKPVPEMSTKTALDHSIDGFEECWQREKRGYDLQKRGCYQAHTKQEKLLRE